MSIEAKEIGYLTKTVSCHSRSLAEFDAASKITGQKILGWTLDLITGGC